MCGCGPFADKACSHYNSLMQQRECNGIVYFLNRRKGLRNLRLHIDGKGRVLVSAPYYVPFSKVDVFVTANSQWIIQHMESVPVRRYETGESIPFLGGEIALEVVDVPLIKGTRKMSQYAINDGKITVYAKNKDIGFVKKEIKKLYVDTVSNVLANRVEYWADEVGVEVPSYGVNSARTKWGVCYPTQNRLYLSYMCAVLPYDLIDMTVLHEVCHLKVHGHGRPFWNLMEEHMPDIGERKARLRELSKAGVNLNLV